MIFTSLFIFTNIGFRRLPLCQSLWRRFYLNSSYQLIPLTDAESQFPCSFELPCYCYDYLHEKNLDEIRIVSYLSLQ